MLVQNAEVVETVPQIVEKIVALPGKKNVLLLAAPSHSGKTFTSTRIEKGLTRENVPVTTVQHDSWNMGRNRTPKDVTGPVPIMEDNDAIGFEKAIHELLSRGVIRPPIYDIQKMWHVTDKGDPVFFEEGVLILDGAFVFLIEGLRKISSLNVYVDIPWDIRRGWLEQCYYGFRNLSPDESERKLKADEDRNGPVAIASARYADLIYRPDPSRLPLIVACNHK